LELVFHHWIEQVQWVLDARSWITMEITSMNKPSMITIHSSSASIGLWPPPIDPLPFTGAAYLNGDTEKNDGKAEVKCDRCLSDGKETKSM
jgi:hypothetical protein